MAINIYPSAGNLPFVQGIAAYFGGKAQGQMQQAQMLHQSTMEQNAQTAQMTRQMVDAYSRTASQVLEHQNQVELRNLAHTQAIGQLDHRHRQALDLKTFTDTKMRLADVEQYAATAGPGGTAIPFHDAYAQLQQKNRLMEMQASGMELRYGSDAERVEAERAEAQIAAMRSDPQWVFPDGSWKPEGLEAVKSITAKMPQKRALPRQKPTLQELVNQHVLPAPDGGLLVFQPDGKKIDYHKPTPPKMAAPHAAGGGGDPGAWPATMPDPLKAAAIQQRGGNAADVAAAQQVTWMNGIPYLLDPKTQKLVPDDGYLKLATAAGDIAMKQISGRMIDGEPAPFDEGEFRRIYKAAFDALTGKPPSASAAPQGEAPSSKPISPDQLSQIREIAKGNGVRAAHARQWLKERGL